MNVVYIVLNGCCYYEQSSLKNKFHWMFLTVKNKCSFNMWQSKTVNVIIRYNGYQYMSKNHEFEGVVLNGYCYYKQK